MKLVNGGVAGAGAAERIPSASKTTMPLLPGVVSMELLPRSPETSIIEQNGTASANQKRKAMSEKNHTRNSHGGVLVATRFSERKRARIEENKIKIEPDFTLPDIVLSEEITNQVYTVDPEVITPVVPPPDPCPVENSIILVKSNGIIVTDAVLSHTKPDAHVKLERLDSTAKPLITILQEIPEEKTTSVLEESSASNTIVQDTVIDISEICIAEMLEVELVEELPLIIASDDVTFHDGEHESFITNPEPPLIDITETENIEINSEEPLDTNQLFHLKVNGDATIATPSRFMVLAKDRPSKQEQADVATGQVEAPGVFPSFIDEALLDSTLMMSLPLKSNYLKAGLLSNYYKQDPVPPCPFDESSSVTDMEATLSVPFTKDTLCPQMANTGLNVPFLMDATYQLPYDVFCFGVVSTKNSFDEWLRVEEERRSKERALMRLERRRSRPSLSILRKNLPPLDSWKFRRLRNNSYFGVSRPLSVEEDQVCDCKDGLSKCATEDCINRVVFTECTDNCGINCKNRRIQKHEWAAGLKQFITKNKGYGVKTMIGVKKGDFILEYVGEVVTAAEFRRRMSEVYANDTHYYCLSLDSGLVIDGHRAGDKGRYVNHSCEPNCEMQKWSVNGMHRMALFALEDILPGEELTYDYNFSLYNETGGQPCFCRSTNCRGVIGVKVASVGKDGNKRGRRKNVGILHGILSSVIFFKGNAPEKPNMKLMSRREVKVIQRSNIFLVRNYEKVASLRRDKGVETKVIHLVGERAQNSPVAGPKRRVSTIKKLNLTGGDPKTTKPARVSNVRQRVQKLPVVVALATKRNAVPTNKKLILTDENPKVFEQALVSSEKSKKSRKNRAEKWQEAKKRLMQQDKLHVILTELAKRVENFSLDPIDLSHLLIKDRKGRKSKCNRLP